MKPKFKCKVYESVKDFYYTVLDYIREKFPINDEPPQSVIEEKRMDKPWNILLNYENKIDKSTPIKNLAKVALAVLSIPHSNAAAERIFSLVRKNRNEYEEKRCVTSQLLSIPALETPSTGENIGDLVLKELSNIGIPIDNCLAMGSDNAAVMLGKKNGVIAKLQSANADVIALGWPCHLINLAAHRAAIKLPVSIDNCLIDIFYYLEGSVNRKLRFRRFSSMFALGGCLWDSAFLA
ncbi:hypothetical protein EGW08_004397 [Elysia chlorotica]|uniref:HAT C-terminal dimerisation domain-containing protein n=1 Tax=Elysia chlorotica TaxID=188477 RepID=A0A433U211_ELYCH|nr:hypothetical protein EGW08_004397 [Elysia chlorotica]